MSSKKKRPPTVMSIAVHKRIEKELLDESANLLLVLQERDNELDRAEKDNDALSAKNEKLKQQIADLLQWGFDHFGVSRYNPPYTAGAHNLVPVDTIEKFRSQLRGRLETHKARAAELEGKLHELRKEFQEYKQNTAKVIAGFVETSNQDLGYPGVL